MESGSRYSVMRKYIQYVNFSITADNFAVANREKDSESIVIANICAIIPNETQE